MKLNKVLIGTRIMQQRKACGYTQEQLSEKIDYSKNHISSVERGLCVPTTQFIFKICEALGETPDFYLIGKTNRQTDEIAKLIESLPCSGREMAANNSRLVITQSCAITALAFQSAQHYLLVKAAKSACGLP